MGLVVIHRVESVRSALLAAGNLVPRCLLIYNNLHYPILKADLQPLGSTVSHGSSQEPYRRMDSSGISDASEYCFSYASVTDTIVVDNPGEDVPCERSEARVNGIYKYKPTPCRHASQDSMGDTTAVPKPWREGQG